jgi:hypothetical protein
MEEDNQSVCSTTSLSNTSIICPECKESLTQKYILNHLRTKHPEDFMLGYFKDNRRLQKTIKDKAPLELKIFLPDERDESDLSLSKKIVLYAVLGTDKNTNKAFTQESRAKGYLKKTPKALKEHLDQLNEILEQLKEAKKLKETFLRGGEWLQGVLKKAYHYLTYVRAPIENLKMKDIDTSDEEARVGELFSLYMKELSVLPTDPKTVIPRATFLKFGNILEKAERLFTSVVSQVDKAYNYPDFVETNYLKCCSESYPEGKRLGQIREWWKNLTYPGDPDTFIDEDTH